MRLNAPGNGHRPGSNIIAAATGVALLLFAGFIFLTGENPLETIRYQTIIGATSLMFGAVLLLWVVSDWKKWIGNETVNMVVGVLAAFVAIAAFAQEIGRGSIDQPCGSGSPSVLGSTPRP